MSGVRVPLLCVPCVCVFSRSVYVCVCVCVCSGCGSGTCVDGWCQCQNFWVGAQCNVQVSHATLPNTLSGSVTGSNVGLTNFFGQVCVCACSLASRRVLTVVCVCVRVQPSGDMYYALTIPVGATSFTVNTCGSATNFATVVWLLNAVPSQQLTNDDIVSYNAEGLACPSSKAGSAGLVSPSLCVCAYAADSQVVCARVVPDHCVRACGGHVLRVGGGFGCW